METPDEYFIGSGDPKWLPERYFRLLTRKQALAPPQGSYENDSQRNLVINGFRTDEHGRKQVLMMKPHVISLQALQAGMEWFCSIPTGRQYGVFDSRRANKRLYHPREGLCTTPSAKNRQ